MYIKTDNNEKGPRKRARMIRRIENENRKVYGCTY